MECSRLRIITGLNTFSSKLPCEPANVTAASLPNTWHATIVIASDCVGLTLPGMIEEPGSFSGSSSSPSPLRGPEPSQRMSFAIFIKRGGERRERAGREHDRVVGGERRELVRRRDERQSGQLGDLRGRRLGEPGRRVQPGADGGAADRELVQAGQRRLDPLDVGVELRHVPAELLAERERDGVLQVRPSDLHDVGELLGRAASASRSAPTLGSRRSHDLSAAATCIAVGNVSLDDCDMFTWSFGWTGDLRAHVAAGHLDRAVGDDLVDVHVRLRARAGLPDEQREVVVERPGDHLVRRRDDEVGELGVEATVGLVDHGRGLLQHAHRADDLERHAVGRGVADREVVERPLGLRAPVTGGVDLHIAHAVRSVRNPVTAAVQARCCSRRHPPKTRRGARQRLPGRLLRMEATLVAKLRAIPIFADLDDDALARVGAVVTEFEAPEGHVLTERGHEGSGMFILEEGTVTVELPRGAAVTLAPGEFFGELAILAAGVTRTARVQAATPVRCLAIARRDFQAILEAEPEIAVAMLPVLARRIADLEIPA